MVFRCVICVFFNKKRTKSKKNSGVSGVLQLCASATSSTAVWSLQTSRREDKDVEAARRRSDGEQQEAQIKDQTSVKIDFLVKPIIF